MQLPAVRSFFSSSILFVVFFLFSSPVLGGNPVPELNAGPYCPSKGEPVNVTNGNVWLEQRDYFLPGPGESLELNRFIQQPDANKAGTVWIWLDNQIR